MIVSTGSRGVSAAFKHCRHALSPMFARRVTLRPMRPAVGISSMPQAVAPRRLCTTVSTEPGFAGAGDGGGAFFGSQSAWEESGSSVRGGLGLALLAAASSAFVVGAKGKVSEDNNVKGKGQSKAKGKTPEELAARREELTPMSTEMAMSKLSAMMEKQRGEMLKKGLPMRALPGVRLVRAEDNKDRTNVVVWSTTRHANLLAHIGTIRDVVKDKYGTDIEISKWEDKGNGTGQLSILTGTRKSSFVLVRNTSSDQIMFYRDDRLTPADLEVANTVYKATLEDIQRQNVVPSGAANSLARLMRGQHSRDGRWRDRRDEEADATIMHPGSPAMQGLDWDCLAGYPHVREAIESNLLLQIKNPAELEIISSKTRGATRPTHEDNRSKAILFEGPPGTGKTTAAKILAAKSELPFMYIQGDKITSKYYGEQEKRLGELMDTAACQPGGCIVFIDEIESMAPSRERGMSHEATNKTLSVLLRRLEGVESNTNVVLVAATNRREDVDAALLSRVSTTVHFHLPPYEARVAIFKRYARQLSARELSRLASRTDGMSARDIKHVCDTAERRLAAERVTKESVAHETPPLEYYEDASQSRASPAGPLQGGIFDV